MSPARWSGRLARDIGHPRCNSRGGLARSARFGDDDERATSDDEKTTSNDEADDNGDCGGGGDDDDNDDDDNNNDRQRATTNDDDGNPWSGWPTSNDCSGSSALFRNR